MEPPAVEAAEPENFLEECALTFWVILAGSVRTPEWDFSFLVFREIAEVEAAASWRPIGKFAALSAARVGVPAQLGRDVAAAVEWSDIAFDDDAAAAAGREYVARLSDCITTGSSSSSGVKSEQ